MTPKQVPDVTFHTRQRITSPDGETTFDWKHLSTADVFGGKRVVLFRRAGGLHARLLRRAPARDTSACTTSSKPRASTLWPAFPSTTPS